jgi:hypothetical protein
LQIGLPLPQPTIDAPMRGWLVKHSSLLEKPLPFSLVEAEPTIQKIALLKDLVHEEDVRRIVVREQQVVAGRAANVANFPF